MLGSVSYTARDCLQDIMGARQCPSDITALHHDRCLLFRSTKDSLTSILCYLDTHSVCQLDIAATNTAARVIWFSSLNMTNHSMISEYNKHCHKSIRWLVKRGIRLGSLKISDCQFDADVTNCGPLLGLNVSLLRDVIFHNCNIGDKEVLFVARYCPYLSEISLFNSPRVTDVSVIELVHCCPQLTTIDLGKCINITDEGLTAFAHDRQLETTANLLGREYHFSLRRMSLIGCTKITDVGVSAVAQNCPLLSNINVSYCRSISDTALSAIAHDCPLLREINVSGCNQITNVGLSALAQNCSLLDEIDTSNCYTISDVGVIAVAHNCPDRKSVV